MTADDKVVLLIVRILGLLAVTGLVGVIVLVWRGTDAELIAIVATMAGGAAGSIGTMLARVGTSPERVVVDNHPSDPVPVEPA